MSSDDHPPAAHAARESERDAERVGALLAEHGPRLRLLLAHQAGRAVRARVALDDLLQEVYLRAWLARERLPSDPIARHRFLALLARHVVVDAARALRAAKRDGRVGPLERTAWSHGGREPAALTAGPATRAALGEQAARMVAAFDALAPEHRRVLGLRHFQGLSARATAQRMGRSETAVHSLFRRALLDWERRAGSAGRVLGDSRDESGADPRLDPA